MTYSHATNTLEVVFCQLFYSVCRLLDVMDEVPAVVDFRLYPLHVAVDEMKSLYVTP